MTFFFFGPFFYKSSLSRYKKKHRRAASAVAKLKMNILNQQYQQPAPLETDKKYLFGFFLSQNISWNKFTDLRHLLKYWK